MNTTMKTTFKTKIGVRYTLNHTLPNILSTCSTLASHVILFSPPDNLAYNPITLHDRGNVIIHDVDMPTKKSIPIFHVVQHVIIYTFSI